MERAFASWVRTIQNMQTVLLRLQATPLIRWVGNAMDKMRFAGEGTKCKDDYIEYCAPFSFFLLLCRGDDGRFA
jgi:hypothetical protein